jgi:hypothetical protein
MRTNASNGTVYLPSSGKPPRFAEFALYFFLNRDHRTAIAGDLAEEYATIILPMFGLRLAKVWYWKQVLWSMPPTVGIYARRLIKYGTTAFIARTIFERFF